MKGRSIVVQDNPRARRIRIAVVFFCAICLFFSGVLAGGWGTLFPGIESSWENQRLRETVVDQARELEELRQFKSDAETRREVDLVALEMVRKELAVQQEAIAELERGVHFYRSLMAPGELSDGLSVHSIDLSPGLELGAFKFRILVQQSSRKHELLTGTLTVRVQGEQGGESISYNLSDLSEQVPDPDIRLRFKYFQAIDGELTLPEGFMPLSVSASARSQKPRRAQVQKEFQWSVQEKLSHVER